MTDSIADTFMSIDPITGGATFNFIGHVKAQGLDLDAGTSATPPDTDKVRWLRTTDGAVVASLSAYDFGGASELDLESIDNNAQRAFVYLRARNPASTRTAQIELSAGLPGGNVSNVYAIASDDTPRGVTKIILDSLGRSDFLSQTNISNLIASASGTLVLANGAFADVPGVTLNWTPNGGHALALVFGQLDFQVTTAIAGQAVGQLLVDGVVQTGQLIMGMDIVTRHTVAGAWLVSGLGSSAHTFKLQADKNVVGGVANALTGGSSNIRVLGLDFV